MPSGVIILAPRHAGAHWISLLVWRVVVSLGPRSWGLKGVKSRQRELAPVGGREATSAVQFRSLFCAQSQLLTVVQQAGSRLRSCLWQVRKTSICKLCLRLVPFLCARTCAVRNPQDSAMIINVPKGGTAVFYSQGN